MVATGADTRARRSRTMLVNHESNEMAVRIARRIAVMVVLMVTTPLMIAGEPRADSSAAFDRLKGLIGTWDVTQKGSNRTEAATYTMTGGGSVLVESLHSPANSAMGHMLTAYHLDKGTLVLTHFCGAGNQPRMRVKTVEDGARTIAFEMYDVTNLADPQAYHSTKLDVVFHDADRVDLVYRGMRAGTESTQVFQLTRKKPTR